MGVALAVQVVQFDRDPEQESQLLDAKVSTPQMPLAILGVGGFHKILEDIEGGAMDSVAEQEFLRPGKFLNGRDQPQQKLEMRFYGGAGFSGIIYHGSFPIAPRPHRLLKKKRAALRADDPRSKELKIKDLTFWPNGNRHRSSG